MDISSEILVRTCSTQLVESSATLDISLKVAMELDSAFQMANGVAHNQGKSKQDEVSPVWIA
jgi:hypothetical protein